MPNKTIFYVREADAEVWERAEKLAGGSFEGYAGILIHERKM